MSKVNNSLYSFPSDTFKSVMYINGISSFFIPGDSIIISFSFFASKHMYILKVSKSLYYPHRQNGCWGTKQTCSVAKITNL